MSAAIRFERPMLWDRSPHAGLRHDAAVTPLADGWAEQGVESLELQPLVNSRSPIGGSWRCVEITRLFALADTRPDMPRRRLRLCPKLGTGDN